MATAATVQILEDGSKNCVVKFEGIVDTVDLASTVIVSPATLAGISDRLACSRLQIKKIIHNIEDLLTINLFWDATTPVRIESLEGRGKGDYHRFGGLVNNAGAGVTGAITATSQGWTTGASLSFSLILELTKS